MPQTFSYHHSKILKTLILAITSIFLLVSCATKDDGLAQSNEQALFQRAQKAIESKRWDEAISTLQRIEERHPFGSYAEAAQLELMYALYRNNEYQAAISTSDRFIRLHPRHRNVDYAYYMRAVSTYYNNSVYSSLLPLDASKRDAGTAKESFNHFAQLIQLFPNSFYTVDAQKRMIFLKNSLAQSEINIANYYFKRGAYLAAANRGRWVVENMQGTPAVPDGLAVMTQAYHLLGMNNLADESKKVLIHNYPDHPALNEGDFNFKYSSDQKKSWLSQLTFGIFDKRPSIHFDSRNQYNAQYIHHAQKNDIAAPPS